MPPRKSYAYTSTPTVTASHTSLGFIPPVASSHFITVEPVFHREGYGRNLENMMSISAMPSFRHLSVEELRVADWNLERQQKAAESLGTDHLQALHLDNSEGDSDATRTQKNGGLSGIPASPSTAGPSNKATGPPPVVLSGQVALSPATFKGTDIGGTSIADATSSAASINVEDRKPTSSFSSSSLSFARFNLPEGDVSLVPPKLRTGTDKSDQVGAAVVPPTPVPVPTPDSVPLLLPQVPNAPQPSGLGSQADPSPISFPISPAAERSFTVADAEKEWVHASRQAHETKAQLVKAQAAHDQAIMMEKLKFKAYCEARNKMDE